MSLRRGWWLCYAKKRYSTQVLALSMLRNGLRGTKKLMQELEVHTYGLPVVPTVPYINHRL